MFCPPQDSASTGNPLKVKPSYQSCKDCLRLPQGRRCDRPAGGRSHRLNPSRHCAVPTICIDPPGTHFAASTPLLPALQAPAVYRCSTCAPPTNRQKLASPMSFEDMDEPGDSAAGQTPRDEAAAAGGLKLQPGGAVELQLQMPGLGIEFGLELMRQRAEQLGKLPGLDMEGQLPVGPPLP